MKAERRASRASARPRTGARVAAVQALFQSEHTGESVETVADQFIRHRIGAPAGAIEFEEGGVPEAHIPLFQAILKQVADHAEAADAAKRAGPWTGLIPCCAPYCARRRVS
jgi:N utilization substance protein B